MTPLLDVQNISKAFGAHVLFENISFSIAEGQHVGLIAKNGTGKSTLLSLLSGKESVDSGSIIFRRDIKVGFLEQQPKFDPEESVLDACFNHQGDPDRILKAKQILTQLHITDLTQPMGQLSGGQQKRIALANVLITEPDLLILDEPTNHLDLEMIEWLEGYLQRGNKTLLMVTHDRYFLDRVCNLILELDNHTVYSYRGNFQYYMEKRQERIDATRAEIERANNLYRRELEWMRRHRCDSRHRRLYRLRRRQTHHRDATLAALPLHARTAIRLCLQAIWWRATQTVSVHRIDAQSQLPRARRTHQRPRHTNA